MFKGENLHVFWSVKCVGMLKTLTLGSLRHHKCNKYQTLHDDTIYWALPVHYTFRWHYFKVTAVSNSFNWKFYVLIWLSSNLVWLLIKSSRSWIYYYFFYCRFDDNDFVSRSHVCQKYKLQIVLFRFLFRFLSAVV